MVDRAKEAALLFARVPRYGQVKTRLALDLGERGALEVYKRFLDRSIKLLSSLGCRRFLFWDREFEESGGLRALGVEEYTQEGHGLGQRMRNALVRMEGLEISKAVIFGSDIPDLHVGIIGQAFSALDEVKVVIGPSKDGGYYLIGCRLPAVYLQDLFSGIPWGTGQVLEHTLSILRGKGIPFSLLPPLYDVDTIDDLRRWLNGVDNGTGNFIFQ